jgi:cytochrome c peroxidase
MKLLVRIIICLSLSLAWVSCKVDPKISETLPSNGLTEVRPANWPAPVYTFSDNVLSEKKFVLGRALFYETLLSADNTISCGTCHQLEYAFANADHKLSHGINDLKGNRNAPAIFNVNWHPYFMHDGGINHIEVQPLGPIANPVEMHEDINNVMIKLKASAKYRSLFTDAFGDDNIDSQRMLKSMAVFMGMMYSYNSKYDKFKRGEDKVTFTTEELRGYALFQSKCNACHTEPLFSDFAFRNNGLAVDPYLQDSGRAHVKPGPENRYKFKTPSLRNVAKTFPYMHDGRYATLEECLEHYNSKVSNSVNLDPLLQNQGIKMTSEEMNDIVKFLNTLTDYSFIYDKRFANPNQ